MAYAINARLNLEGPTNLRPIVNNINQQLRGVHADVDVRVRPEALRSLSTANTQLTKIAAVLSSVERNAISATSALTQMANVLNSSNARLGPVASGIQSISKTSSSATAKVHEFSSSMEKLGHDSAIALRRFSAFSIAAGTLLSVVTAMKAGVSKALDFQDSMVKISQVTDKTVAGLSGLEKAISRTAIKYGVDSKKLVDLSLTLSQANLSARDTRIAMEALAKTELAPTFKDIENTTEAAIAAMNQFQISASKLEGTLGSINQISAKYAVESEDLSTTIRKAGGAFDAAGGSLEELLALFTSVRQTTRLSADTIATGFNTIFARVQRKDTIENFKRLGIELRDVEGNFIGPFKAIQAISKELKGIPETGPLFASIVEELGGIRQIKNVIPLLKQSQLQVEALGVAMTGQDSLNKDVEKSQASLNRQIQKTKEEFFALFREIVSTESFKGMLKFTLQLTQAFIRMADALKDVAPLLLAVATIKIGNAATQFLKGTSISGLLSPNPDARGFLSTIGTKRTTAHTGGMITGSGALRFARGGQVPGTGVGDKIPALLEPGEFVLNKKAAQAIGFDRLVEMNQVKRLQGGTDDGGLAVGGVGSVRPTTVSKFNKPLQDKFFNVINEFSKATTIASKELIELVPAISDLQNQIYGGGQGSVQQKRSIQKEIVTDITEVALGKPETPDSVIINSNASVEEKQADRLQRRLEANRRKLGNENIEIAKQEKFYRLRKEGLSAIEAQAEVVRGFGSGAKLSNEQKSKLEKSRISTQIQPKPIEDIDLADVLSDRRNTYLHVGEAGNISSSILPANDRAAKAETRNVRRANQARQRNQAAAERIINTQEQQENDLNLYRQLKKNPNITSLAAKRAVEQHTGRILRIPTTYDSEGKVLRSSANARSTTPIQADAHLPPSTLTPERYLAEGENRRRVEGRRNRQDRRLQEARARNARGVDVTGTYGPYATDMSQRELVSMPGPGGSTIEHLSKTEFDRRVQNLYLSNRSNRSANDTTTSREALNQARAEIQRQTGPSKFIPEAKQVPSNKLGSVYNPINYVQGSGFNGNMSSHTRSNWMDPRSGMYGPPGGSVLSQPGFFSRNRTNLSNLKTGFGNLNNRLGQSSLFSSKTAFAGFALAGLAASQTPTIDESVEAQLSGKKLGFLGSRAGQGSTGGLTGAVAGASIGAIAGPVGIAIGGLVGAAHGAISSLREFDNALSDAKLEESAKKLSESFDAFFATGSKEDLEKGQRHLADFGKNFNEKLNKQIQLIGQGNQSTFEIIRNRTLLGAATGAAAGAAGGTITLPGVGTIAGTGGGSILGGVVGAGVGTYEALTREKIDLNSLVQSSQEFSPQVEAFIKNQIEKGGDFNSVIDTKEERVNLGISKFTENDKKLVESGAVPLDYLAEVRFNQFFLPFIDNLKKSKEALDAEKKIRDELTARKQDEIEQINRLGQAVIGFESKLNNVGAQSKRFAVSDLADLISGGAGSVGQALDFSSIITNRQNDPQEFAKLVNRVSGIGGEEGIKAGKEAIELNKLQTKLPDVLDQAFRAVGDKAEPVQIANKVEELLGGGKIAKSIGSRVRALKSEELPDIFEKGGQVAFSDKTINDIGNQERVDFLAKAAKTIQERVAEILGDVKLVIDSEKQLADARLGIIDKEKNIVDFQLERRRSRGETIGLGESVGLAQSAFVKRQQALAGSAALDPQALVDSLSIISKQRENALQRGQELQAGGGTEEEIQQNALAVGRLNIEYDKHRQALQNLTQDTSALSAAQQRLTELQQSEQQRLSFAERFITSSRQEKFQLGRNVNLAQSVARTGNIQNLQPEKIKEVLDIFGSFGSNEIIKGLTGDQAKQNVLKGVLGGELGGVFGGASKEQAEKQAAEKVINQNLINNLTAQEHLIQSVDNLVIELKGKTSVGFASGGAVAGIGNRDTVSAMLMPGEFVINKQAAKAIGLNNLHQLNNAQHFADGGAVQDIHKVKSANEQGGVILDKLIGKDGKFNLLEKRVLGNMLSSAGFSRKQTNEYAQFLESIDISEAYQVYEDLLPNYAKITNSLSEITGNIDPTNINASTVKEFINSAPKAQKEELSNLIRKTTSKERSRAGFLLGSNINRDLNFIENALRGQKFASGGQVPGIGNSDSVPAVLTPGEFVINKKSAQSIGLGNLNRLNGFKNGGAVGNINGSNFGLNDTSLSAFNNFGKFTGMFSTSIDKFGATINNMVDVLNKIPSEIIHTGNHTVNLNISGTPALRDFIVNIVDEQLRRSPGLPASSFEGEARLRNGVI